MSLPADVSIFLIDEYALSKELEDLVNSTRGTKAFISYSGVQDFTDRFPGSLFLNINDIPKMLSTLEELLGISFRVSGYVEEKQEEAGYYNVNCSLTNTCKGACTFCHNNQRKDAFSIIDSETTSLERIEGDFQARIQDDDIFDSIQIEQLGNYIRQWTGVKKIALWTSVRNIVLLQDNITRLLNSFPDIKFVFNVGIESWSKSQLKRFNKSGFYDQFIDAHNNITSKLTTGNLRLLFLYLNFDPWVTPKEISENIQGHNDFLEKARGLSCGSTRVNWASLVDRSWMPKKNTGMYKKAVVEGLLNLQYYNEYGVYIGDQEKTRFECMHLSPPWKFVDTYSEYAFKVFSEIYAIQENVGRAVRAIPADQKDKSLDCKFCSATLFPEALGKYLWTLNDCVYEFLDGKKENGRLLAKLIRDRVAETYFQELGVQPTVVF